MKIYKTLLLLLIVGLFVLPGQAQEDDGIDGDTAEAIGAVEQKVIEMRGLELIEGVPRALWAPEDVEAWLIEQLNEEYPPEMARDDVIVYNAFDFMPLKTDLWQLQFDVLREQIAGFYETEAKYMVVVDFGNGFDAFAEVIYSHEFTHALQDQHFDLEGLGLGPNTDPAQSSDLLLARQALVEGDAYQLMQDYLIWRAQQEDGIAFSIELFGSIGELDMTQLANAPSIVNAELLFPLAGQAFVQDVLSRGGWVLLDAIYERPPLSTEQILHPQQYFDADEPQVVELTLPDDVLGARWRLVEQSSLGEFYLREYLAQHLPANEVAVAAEGWGGDGYAVYHDDASGETVWLLRLQWDAISHAHEFIDAFTAFASARYGGAVPTAEGEGRMCWQGGVHAPDDADSKEVMRYDTTCLYYVGGDTLIVQGPDLDIVIAVGDLQALID